MSDKKLGVICWHSNETGYESEGGVFEYDKAVALAQEMNKEYPELAHWVREVKPKTTIEKQD